MVGMHAVVMDGVVLGAASIVAACAFVKEGWQVPPRVLVAGVPGRVMRLLTDEEIRAKSSGTRIYQNWRRIACARCAACETYCTADKAWLLVWMERISRMTRATDRSAWPLRQAASRPARSSMPAATPFSRSPSTSHKPARR